MLFSKMWYMDSLDLIRSDPFRRLRTTVSLLKSNTIASSSGLVDSNGYSPFNGYCPSRTLKDIGTIHGYNDVTTLTPSMPG